MQVSRGVIAKCRRKVMYGSIRKELGPIMRELAQQKESEVEEGHLMGDHIHMMLTIPPVFGIGGGGVHQGKECDSDRPKIYGSEEELCRVELLGERILRVDGGAGREAGTSVYQRAGERRSSARSTMFE